MAKTSVTLILHPEPALVEDGRTLALGLIGSLLIILDISYVCLFTVIELYH